MRKIILSLVSLAAAFCLLGSATSVFAADETPSLRDVSFSNATVQEKVSPARHDYTLVLTDPTQTPTLENCEIDGSARVFVEYLSDEAGYQHGIQLVLKYDDGTLNYTFMYQNVQRHDKNDNNYLRTVSCPLGVVYPKLTRDTDRYRIYVPSDLTELELNAAPEDVDARCEVPGAITLRADQEVKIVINVVASDGSVRPYTFHIRRLDKTSQEVAQILQDGNADSLIKSERFYQKPTFLITFFGIVGSALLLWLMVNLTKRFAVQAEDKDETEFFESQPQDEA